MNAKMIWIATATAAVLLAWVGGKLWWAPPQDLMGVVRMTLKGACLAGVFFAVAISLWDKMFEGQRAD